MLFRVVDTSTHSHTHTYSLAGFGRWVHLVAICTLTLVTAHLVNTDLAARVCAGTLVNICVIEQEAPASIL